MYSSSPNPISTAAPSVVSKTLTGSATDVTEQILQQHIQYGASENTAPQGLAASKCLNFANGASIQRPERQRVTVIPYTLNYQGTTGLFGAENYFYIGPLSPINQYTPKRLLSNLSEIKNFPVLDQIDFNKISNNLCVLPGISNQLINVNTLNNTHKNLIASFFDEENLEFIESQILDAPENGYDSANEFAKKITQSVSWPSQVLSINSKTLLISSKIYNQTFSNQLDSLVILENSNSAKVLNRDFSF